MLQIEQNNLLIQKTLSERVFDSADGFKSLDRIITDFDFTTYHISTLPDHKQLVLVSIYLKCWDDLNKYGVVEYLNGKYAEYAGPLAVLQGSDLEAGYNYSLVLDLAELAGKDDEFKQKVIDELSFLKRHAMAAPFEKAFARYDELAKTYANANTYSEEIQAELQNEKVLVIKYRGSDESIYIKPSFDRVTVIFSTVFQDETDKIFGRVFLQEFVDARKRSVQTAPQVLYSHKDAPLDIQNVVEGSKDDENKGYITFVLFPRHLVKGDRRDNCISHIQFFRNYFHYHIKCSKAYMHSRMRFRVKEFLKILNRAKPENVDDDGKAIENRKTASGRRFDIASR
ncbi:Arp complex subunit [Scheffersomyces stipitis CBS 6054]|uniref:Arp2/3 complex 34 kDa subunit n=1 Tax=Scheffersomyces stipitis (strain ATCC 58785 / CBS 6054 / NBRC 10063 / NRRL Y-11545) TaxID=322104 RepID=A3GFR5_PICST|nr:Arp complex subunit [Scheffersomyces stipitis CBS 6054]EAZ63798.2 Arp complex subunit [Scheffersomyces stipitis CBS 6054]KAG2735093.1 hypothetical protein G9P44_001307 [Scheffersomyces stipitis]